MDLFSLFEVLVCFDFSLFICIYPSEEDDSFVMTRDQVDELRGAVEKSKISPLFTSIIWIAVGAFILHYFDLSRVLMFDSRISRFV